MPVSLSLMVSASPWNFHSCRCPFNAYLLIQPSLWLVCATDFPLHPHRRLYLLDPSLIYSTSESSSLDLFNYKGERSIPKKVSFIDVNDIFSRRGTIQPTSQNPQILYILAFHGNICVSIIRICALILCLGCYSCCI